MATILADASLEARVSSTQSQQNLPYVLPFRVGLQASALSAKGISAIPLVIFVSTTPVERKQVNVVAGLGVSAGLTLTSQIDVLTGTTLSVTTGYKPLPLEIPFVLGGNPANINLLSHISADLTVIDSSRLATRFDAIIEATSLPGFPYIFPRKFGVAFKASTTVIPSRSYTSTSSLAVIASSFAQANTVRPGNSAILPVQANASASTQTIERSSGSSNISASLSASVTQSGKINVPQNVYVDSDGSFVASLVTQSILNSVAWLASSIKKQTFVSANLNVIAAGEANYLRTIDANLAVNVSNFPNRAASNQNFSVNALNVNANPLVGVDGQHPVESNPLIISASTSASMSNSASANSLTDIITILENDSLRETFGDSLPVFEVFTSSEVTKTQYIEALTEVFFIPEFGMTRGPWSTSWSLVFASFSAAETLSAVGDGSFVVSTASSAEFKNDARGNLDLPVLASATAEMDRFTSVDSIDLEINCSIGIPELVRTRYIEAEDLSIDVDIPSSDAESYYNTNGFLPFFYVGQGRGV